MKIIKSFGLAVSKIFRSATGAALLDPIEVFYLPDLETFFPIVSKSGNSSVKLSLINRYNESFYSSFPEIHRIDPAPITTNRVVRIFFFKGEEYREFAKGKKMELVIRNPYDRLYSCYLGVKSERNIMYKYPSRLNRLLYIPSTIKWRTFVRLVTIIPDRLADKHFRPQSFYLQFGVVEKLAELKVHAIDDFIRENSNIYKEVRLNKSNEKITKNEYDWLHSKRLFRSKFKEDIDLFKAALSK